LLGVGNPIEFDLVTTDKIVDKVEGPWEISDFLSRRVVGGNQNCGLVIAENLVVGHWVDIVQNNLQVCKVLC
jgi:hypothetical protein